MGGGQRKKGRKDNTSTPVQSSKSRSQQRSTDDATSRAAPPSTPPKPRTSASQRAMLEDVLADLTSRFFLNLHSELDSFERVFFQLEQAYWYYEDFLRDPAPSHLCSPSATGVKAKALPKLSFRQFCVFFFETSAILRAHLKDFDALFATFRKYLSQVPVCGGILLDPSLSRCVLVRGWKGVQWGFPKGKINQHESHIDCAIREVLEETGFDMGSLLSPQHYLHASGAKGQNMKLFLAPGVPLNTVFLTKTRKEIEEIRFFEVESLLDTSRCPVTLTSYVRPFLVKLQTWIQRHGSAFQHKKQLQHSQRAQPFETDINSNRSRSAPANKHNSKTHSRSQTVATDGGSFVPDLAETFGDSDFARGWTPEEMFETNARLYGVVSSLSANPDELTSSMSTMAFQRLRTRDQCRSPLFVDESKSDDKRSSVLSNFQLDSDDIMSTLSLSMQSS